MGSRSTKTDAIWLSFLVGARSLHKNDFLNYKTTICDHQRACTVSKSCVSIVSDSQKPACFAKASVFILKTESGFASTLLDQMQAALSHLGKLI